MTREEEIMHKVGSIVDGMVSNNVISEICDSYYQGFIEGAKWADNNPKKGLVSIDKVCAYLEMRLDDYIIRDLRKTMEGDYEK